VPDVRKHVETDILIAGGGVAALETLLALHERIGTSRRVTLLAPHTDFRYRPLTAYGGLVPGPRTPVDLRAVAAEHGAAFEHDQLTAVHPDRCEAATPNGLRIAYQALVVAIGAVAINPFPGAVTLGLPREEAAFEAFVRRVRDGTLERVVVVVPPRLGWTLPAYEAALMLRHASATLRITVTTPEAAPMERFGPEIAAAIDERLRERQIDFCPETFPVTVADGELWVRSHGLVAADAVVALARPAGPIISGLPIDPLGFIPVDETSRVIGTTGIWAAGDAAAHHTKQGGFALQQAEAASEDIVDTLTDAPAGDVAPPAPLVMRAALLDGDRVLYLRAEQQDHGWRGVASWDPLWEPPGKIAGGRLTRYLAKREAESE
jgi:sulfide:quinone oxidoreductase